MKGTVDLSSSSAIVASTWDTRTCNSSAMRWAMEIIIRRSAFGVRSEFRRYDGDRLILGLMMSATRWLRLQQRVQFRFHPAAHVDRRLGINQVRQLERILPKIVELVHACELP